MAKKRGTAVVVTTDKRGVFFGRLEKDDVEKNKVVVLTGIRNCFYWAVGPGKGVLGLATHGPAAGSKIGPAAIRSKLTDVTSVTECSEAAIKAWETTSWT